MLLCTPRSYKRCPTVRFPTKILYTLPHICATFPTTLIVLRMSKILCSSSLRCLLQRGVISILFCSNIFLQVVRSNCLVCVLPSVRGTKLHVVILFTFICTLEDHHSERIGNNHSPNKTLIIEPPSSSKPHRNVEIFTPTYIAPCARRLGTQFFLGGGASPLFSA